MGLQRAGGGACRSTPHCGEPLPLPHGERLIAVSVGVGGASPLRVPPARVAPPSLCLRGGVGLAEGHAPRPTVAPPTHGACGGLSHGSATPTCRCTTSSSRTWTSACRASPSSPPAPSAPARSSPSTTTCTVLPPPRPTAPPSPTAPRPCPHVGCWALWGDDRRRGTGERLRPSMGWGGGEGGGVGNTPPLTPRSPASPVDPVDAESTRMDSNFGLAGGGLGGSPRARGRIECKCGAAACRKYLF